MPRLTCTNCGDRIDVPAGFARAKARCPECGYYTDVPAEIREAEPEPPIAPPVTVPPTTGRPRKARVVPRGDPRDTRPLFEPATDDPAGPPLLEGTDDFDDDQPYAVPGTGTRPCPHCRGELPLDAQFCVHCGRDIATGRKPTRQYQPVSREWFEGWHLSTRWAVLVAVLAIDAMLLGIAISANGGVVSNVLGMMFNVVMQAFILGTFRHLSVKRNPTGKTTITVVQRIAFVPTPTNKVEWRQSQAVGTVPTHDSGVMAWFFCVYLLLLGVLPGLIFYWLVIRPERCEVTLCDHYGATDARVFRAAGHPQAAEIASVISTATGLTLKRVV